MDSTICEFQSIASILKLAFENLSSLGKCVDVVLRTLSASMVTGLCLNKSDVNVQLQRVLECRQNVLVTQKYISSLSGQCQTFEYGKFNSIIIKSSLRRENDYPFTPVVAQDLPC